MSLRQLVTSAMRYADLSAMTNASKTQCVTTHASKAAKTISETAEMMQKKNEDRMFNAGITCGLLLGFALAAFVFMGMS